MWESCRGTSSMGSTSKKIVGALAGDGSGGKKAKGGGLCIATTLFFHEHVICLQRIVVLQGRTKNKRSDRAIPASANGDDPSQVCPPAGCRGWLERRSRMLLKCDTISTDGRHERTVLRCSDASDLCPLLGAVASCQIIQTSPPRKCPGGRNKDDNV